MALTIHVANATITVMLGTVDDGKYGKYVVAYSIRLPFVPDGESFESGRVEIGDDMRAPMRGSRGDVEAEAMRSLLSFLSAAAEATGHPDSENADLFPADVTAWAAHNSDEIIGMTMVMSGSSCALNCTDEDCEVTGTCDDCEGECARLTA